MCCCDVAAIHLPRASPDMLLHVLLPLQSLCSCCGVSPPVFCTMLHSICSLLPKTALVAIAVYVLRCCHRVAAEPVDVVEPTCNVYHFAAFQWFTVA
jgi:hypothetical protein